MPNTRFAPDLQGRHKVIPYRMTYEELELDRLSIQLSADDIVTEADELADSVNQLSDAEHDRIALAAELLYVKLLDELETKPDTLKSITWWIRCLHTAVIWEFV